MRTFTLTAVIIFFFGIFLGNTYAKEDKFVKIKAPFANIYAFLDPESKIIKQGKKGDYFELVYEGTSWYQVRVQNKIGWLEKRDGIVVDSPSLTILSVPVETFVIFIVLLLGTFASASILIYRQKSLEY